MPVSYAKLKAMLDVDEPDYPALAEMAAGAMQHVRKLAASADVSVASKAVSLAGIIGDADSIGILGTAAKSRDALVRVAAAHAVNLLPDSPQAARVVSKLLDDKDAGVLKFATRAATRMSDPSVKVKAKRSKARMETTVRALKTQSAKQERTQAMATKASKKAMTAATKTKATRKGSAKAATGKMPTGAMMEPKKGAKAGDMPTGKMR